MLVVELGEHVINTGLRMSDTVSNVLLVECHHKNSPFSCQVVISGCWTPACDETTPPCAEHTRRLIGTFRRSGGVCSAVFEPQQR